MHFQLLGLAALGSLAAAAPADLVERASCTFTSAAQAAAGVQSCSNVILRNIQVPAGQTLDLTKAKKGATITFEGTTTFGYKEWTGPLIRFAGTGITVTQAPGAVIDGQGMRWWDTKGTNGGKKKPKFIYAHKLYSSTIKGLHIKNSPVQVFSVQGNEVHLNDITIDNSAGDKQGGHNTDAFDVNDSNGVYIVGANVKNQDDCLAINSGTNIHFNRGTCSGGHGISIGSVGGRSNNVVKDVFISDSTVVDSDNGIRIKTISGATGSVSGIHYGNIILKNIKKNGIVIQQDYLNGGPTGKPTTGVPITNVNVNGVTGSVAGSATPVYLLCGKGSCSNWTWKGVNISGGKKSSKCQNVPSGASC
ncbi:glycoside hydrolase [Aspergillus coremiiformis]|uniref:endo-polygalacturonase n=1 Tax=Aspergillus coremiiformis TaxID=138285 RepID=A0A5N6ZGU9_9EURO|nr:glycoside hydrolase [Aspergillus coremiiformis]